MPATAVDSAHDADAHRLLMPLCFLHLHDSDPQAKFTKATSLGCAQGYPWFEKVNENAALIHWAHDTDAWRLFALLCHLRRRIVKEVH